MADFKKKIIFIYQGHRLSIQYTAYKSDDRYSGSCMGFFGTKTIDFVKTLSDEEYSKLWDLIDDYSLKSNLPY